MNTIKARMRDRQEANEDGFTLIELLIVIVILGILAAIVIFSVTGVTNKGALSACKADVKTLDTAAESYFAQQSTGATTLTALVTAGFLHNDSSIAATTKTVNGGAAPNGYTITYTPGSGTSAGSADVSNLAGCP